MDLKEFLEKEKMINKSEVAREMYPDINGAPIRLMQKLKGHKAGSGPQRFTDGDTAKAKDVFRSLRSRLDEFIGD